MTIFPVSARRADPYKNFRFRILWGASGNPVAGFSKVGPLKRRVKPGSRGKRATKNNSAASTPFESITLERGVTHHRAFLRWASGPPPRAGSDRERGRRDVCIELRSAAGRRAQRYKVLHCLVSEFREGAGPEAGAQGIVIERMRLAHEGCEPDLARRRRVT